MESPIVSSDLCQPFNVTALLMLPTNLNPSVMSFGDGLSRGGHLPIDPGWPTGATPANPAALAPCGEATLDQKQVAAPKGALSPDCKYKRGPVRRIWGVPLDVVTMEQTIDAIDAMVQDRVPRYLITANLNYAMVLNQDPSLKAITEDAAMIVADGQPMVWRSRTGKGESLPERVAGSELIYHLASRASQRKWRVYFIGAEPGVAMRCATTLANSYPGMVIAGVQSPPYRALTDAEQQQQLQAIREAKPDILLVAFGQPKGERWIHQHYQSLGVPVAIQLGASFDFVAGTAVRAPKIWQKLGLEWAYRMFSDPGRLLPRYANNLSFLAAALLRDWGAYVNERFGDANQTARS